MISLNGGVRHTPASGSTATLVHEQLRKPASQLVREDAQLDAIDPRLAHAGQPLLPHQPALGMH